MPSSIIPDADILRVSAGPGALHVERYGNSGDAVLLLHGFGTTSFLWRGLGTSLAAAGYTAYAMDMLGYGESDRPFEADYSIAAQAQYVERALTSLRVQRAAVVGVDIGGGVAQRLAVAKKNGVQVSHLALINSVGLDQCPGREVRNVQRDTARFAFHVSRGVLAAAPLLRRLLEASVADQKHMPERLLARYMAPFAGSDGVTHLLVLARALHAEDVEDLELATITAPTLIIWGETDAWLDSGLAERLQGAIPQTRVIRLPGVGRLVPEETPDTLSELLLEFLRS